MRMPRLPSRFRSRTRLRECDRAFFIETVRHRERLGMIRDRDIFVAQLARGLGHLFERCAAVGFRGVHVQVAADIGELQQLGQPVLSAASISPQFSRSSGGIQSRPSAA